MVMKVIIMLLYLMLDASNVNKTNINPNIIQRKNITLIPCQLDSNLLPNTPPYAPAEVYECSEKINVLLKRVMLLTM